jgi:hypothetical protein
MWSDANGSNDVLKRTLFITPFYLAAEFSASVAITMKPSQNSLFKADTYVRAVAESGILGLVHGLCEFTADTISLGV